MSLSAIRFTGIYQECENHLTLPVTSKSINSLVGFVAQSFERIAKRMTVQDTASGVQNGCKTNRILSYVRTDVTRTPNIVGLKMLGVVASMLAVVCKQMQQLPTTRNNMQQNATRCANGRNM